MTIDLVNVFLLICISKQNQKQVLYKKRNNTHLLCFLRVISMTLCYNVVCRVSGNFDSLHNYYGHNIDYIMLIKSDGMSVASTLSPFLKYIYVGEDVK